MESENRCAYTKPPKSIEEQIQMLEERGLIIDDKDRISGYLRNISYYHLSSYFKSFQKKVDVFDDEVSFEKVINVYEFDKKLRLLVLDITERIEKAFKSRLIHELSMKINSSHWHTEITNYKSDESFEEQIKPQLEKAKGSKEIDLKNYYAKYNSPEYPPAWIFFESLTFGEVLTFYRNLTAENKKIVSKTFNIPHNYLGSWMFGLSFIRNISAHHARLWNKRMPIKILIDHRRYRQQFNGNRPDNLYNYLLIAQIFMQKINPTSQWFERLKGLIEEHNIPVSQMGFPERWEERFREISAMENIEDRV